MNPLFSFSGIVRVVWWVAVIGILLGLVLGYRIGLAAERTAALTTPVASLVFTPDQERG
ncbi:MULTISPECIES: hypothetical protein [unclassified Crossiella]|uniref:hypothetical protein n=1 Tax=unclassified Crossiella TaxID=2620835 RepID=UPI001FFE8638|nr:MULTISPECIES: hypothetical protein [unclassified Crossiella]MCK2243803.1 hypothetical protein [Crossiella sp. S99.2]MCK2257662.1 hypothetical protein [Crossiella sp. S99.1]